MCPLDPEGGGVGPVGLLGNHLVTNRGGDSFDYKRVQRVNGQTAAVAAIYKQSGRLLD